MNRQIFRWDIPYLDESSHLQMSYQIFQELFLELQSLPKGHHVSFCSYTSTYIYAHSYNCTVYIEISTYSSLQRRNRYKGSRTWGAKIKQTKVKEVTGKLWRFVCTVEPKSGMSLLTTISESASSLVLQTPKCCWFSQERLDQSNNIKQHQVHALNNLYKFNTFWWRVL